MHGARLGMHSIGVLLNGQHVCNHQLDPFMRVTNTELQYMSDDEAFGYLNSGIHVATHDPCTDEHMQHNSLQHMGRNQFVLGEQADYQNIIITSFTAI
jgi:hypothetical protein